MGSAAGVELPPNRLLIPEIIGDKNPSVPPNKLDAILPSVLPAELPCDDVLPCSAWVSRRCSS